ncbi:type IVB secretion system protein IcmH/DotU [Puniceibacterium confluentis]|uniref:type IVB secretion system protein IcmH/DotU n=1 Tax=Puniceibacterium confluentis TaxID=1958944 RepID=UPI0011B6F3A9|nr:type IVB secretion system protein IcmH/DotU [Puniceibacterium confluentis]
MNGDDPFGLENDAGRTRIRPVRRAAQAPRQQPGAATTAPVRTTRASDNPLLNAYAALLGMAPELERATAPENPDVLRTRLLDSLTHARDSAVSAGVPLSRADQGAWFVAALLDDIALNTPWGGHSGWPRMPLVVSMYGNVDAGERFFDLAEDLIRFPERDPQLLQLVFLCLSLGFRGKYRLDPGAGEAAIAQLRVQMNRLLRDRDAADAALAPNWKGVEAADDKRGFVVPLWSIGLMALALIGAVYVALSIQLSNRGEQLFTLAGVLPPPERADIFRPVIDSVQKPLLSADPLVFELLPLFGEAAPKATAKALTGREDVSIAVVVVQATDPEVFRSSKADLNGGYDTLITSIATVIRDNAEFIGSVRVVGHTDSIPVQTSNPFRSNQGLSEARAKRIAEALVAAGVPPGLVTSEGKAASEPIADNGTKSGRARNRRVEIILQKKV